MDAPVLNLYIVRCLFRGEGGYRPTEFNVWAYSAADAKVQTETYRGVDSSFSGVQYVGPVKPKCKCLNPPCYCGVSAVV